MEVCANYLLNYTKIPGQFREVSSFFKVMFGTNFSEVLFLPPKFAKTLSRSYVGRRMHLKDSNGQKWNVLLSNVDGTLAFQKGWHEFSVDHGIEVGDFVVFHHIVRSSHFVVQIFGRSGCEKLASSIGKSYQNKRMKTTRDAFDLHAPHSAFYEPQPNNHPSSCVISRPNDNVLQRPDDNEEHVERSSPVAENHASSHEKITPGLKGKPPVVFLEDMSYMLDRTLNFAEESDRKDLFDLSKFEMPKKKAVAKEVDALSASVGCKTCHDNDDDMFSKNEESYPLTKEYTLLPGISPSADMPSSSSMTRRPVALPHKCEPLASSGNEGSCSLKMESTSLPNNFPITDMPSSSSMTQTPFGMPLKYEPVAPSGSCDWEAIPSVANHEGIAFGLEFPTEGWWRELGDLGPTPTLRHSPMPSTQSYEMAGRITVVKQEPGGLVEYFRDDVAADTYPCHNATLSVGNGGPRMTMKSEPIDLFDSSPAPVAKITCSVQAGSNPFFELPEPLPVKGCKSAKLEKKMVILHDPAGRLWPVLYHQRYGFKVLASGWSSFMKANDIHLGDECTFTVQNRDEGIFAVTIHRTPGT